MSKDKTIWIVRYTDTEKELTYNQLVTDDLFLAVCYVKQNMDFYVGMSNIHDLKELWKDFRKKMKYLDWRDNSALRPEYCSGYLIEEFELNKLPV